jgi:ribonucleotide monophosphatase NagD (HAD superfamily)
MIGDSFHTDILGGAGAGWRTVLVTDHGLSKGHNIAEMVKSTGIVPDFIIPSI